MNTNIWILRVIIVFLGLGFFSNTSYAQFYGGDNDGYASDTTRYANQLMITVFSGGDNDGYSSDTTAYESLVMNAVYGGGDNDGYAIDGTLTTIIWSGAVSSAWDDAANWDKKVPDTWDYITIPDLSAGVNRYPVITCAAETNFFILNENATVIIKENGSFTIHGDATLNGHLKVLSSASQSGSFIDEKTLSFDNNQSYKRSYTRDTWHTISSPISDGESSVFIDNYLHIFNEQDTVWEVILPTDVPLTPMKGFVTKSFDNKVVETDTAVFYGTFNTGALSFDYTLSGSVVGNDRFGWNLLGNPYPSYIDWDLVTIPATLGAGVSVWDATTDSYKYYITGGGGLNTASQYIAPGQGFFVRCNDELGGTLYFDNDIRVHETSTFYKESIKQNSDDLLLSISGLGKTTSTGISIKEEASADFDGYYDIYNLGGDRSKALQLYSKTNEVNYSINSVSMDDLPTSFPLYFYYDQEGLFTLESSLLEDFDNSVSVFLEDKNDGSIKKLQKANSIDFYHSLNDMPNRFVIHMNIATSIDEQISDELIEIWASNKKVYVSFDKYESGKVSVYSVSGACVYSQVFKNKTSVNFNTNLNKGIYIVSVQKGSGVINRKVLLY